MSKIETTLIKSISINHAYFEEHFSLWRIGYQDYKEKEERTARLATLARDIYTCGPVLALHHYRKENCCYVLLPRSESLCLRDNRLTLSPVDITQAYNWLMANLLIKALPSQLLDLSAKQDVTRFDAEGLHYLVRYDSLQECTSPQVIAVEVGMAPQPLAYSGQMLKIFVRTFTPMDAFLNEHGELPKKLKRKERYRLDQRSQCLHKSVDGEYLKKGYWRNERKRVAMLDLQKQSLGDYQGCKLGILGMFLKDLEQAYCGEFSLKLQQINFTERRWLDNSKVNSQYKLIRQTIKNYPFALIDKAGDSQAVIRLRLALKQIGFNVTQVETPMAGACNILIVPHKDLFNGIKELDPYLKVKLSNPDKIIQACYPESLEANKDGLLVEHILDVLLKELLIKIEYKERHQLLDGYPIPAGAMFIYPWKKGEEEGEDDEEFIVNWGFLAMEVRDGRLFFNVLEKKHIDDMLDSIDDPLLKSRLNSRYWSQVNLPFIYWPDSGDVLAFIDTEAVVLPDYHGIEHALSKLSVGRAKTLSVELLEEFCNTFPENTVVSQLQTLLTSEKKEYNYDDLRTSKINNRGGNAQFFYGWLADRLGAPLKVSLQGKGGVLDATTGFGLDLESGLYFSGAVGGAKLKVDNFSHIYHLHTTLSTIPSEILQLMQPMHVKNKGFTVYPLPFKYLREYAAELTMQRNDSVDNA